MKVEKILGYEVHRKKVKNINLRIRPNMEIYISAPMNLHSDYIENFIRSKEKWIKQVLQKIKEAKQNQLPSQYLSGEKHKYLGKEYELEVKQGNSNRVSLKEGKIILTVISNIFENSDEKKKVMEKWYFENAQKVFVNAIQKWLKILDELIKRTQFEIEYVVLHELTHLKYPNHGKGFYRYIENYMPNYKMAEKMLNAKHYY